MTAPAPQLLVSVRDAREALDALAGGADWIDLKEPQRGALGPVDATIARDVVQSLDNRAPISAAAGELRDWAGSPAEALLGIPGVSHVKLGLSRCAGLEWHRPWRAAQRKIAAAGKQLVAVIYADAAQAEAPTADDVLAAADEANCPWVLWDTFDKSGGPLDVYLAHAELVAQLTAARTMGRRTVVAGRLDAEVLTHLPLELIDMIGLRGAVCRGTRYSSVCKNKVAVFRAAIVATQMAYR